jgi:hypothetical protein
MLIALAEFVGEGAGMNIKHITKLALGITVLFLGFQFGRDIANKVNSSTSTSTPAS